MVEIKVLKKLSARIVNNDVLKDTLLLTSMKNGKQYMVDSYLRELKKEKIHGLCAVHDGKRYAVYSDGELYGLMRKLKVDEIEINVVPMDTLAKFSED